ncbi:hypothetical protein Tco_0275963 [Tanacetum coccineum]
MAPKRRTTRLNPSATPTPVPDTKYTHLSPMPKFNAMITNALLLTGSMCMHTRWQMIAILQEGCQNNQNQPTTKRQNTKKSLCRWIWETETIRWLDLCVPYVTNHHVGPCASKMPQCKLNDFGHLGRDCKIPKCQHLGLIRGSCLNVVLKAFQEGLPKIEEQQQPGRRQVKGRDLRCAVVQDFLKSPVGPSPGFAPSIMKEVAGLATTGLRTKGFFKTKFLPLGSSGSVCKEEDGPYGCASISGIKQTAVKNRYPLLRMFTSEVREEGHYPRLHSGLDTVTMNSKVQFSVNVIDCEMHQSALPVEAKISSHLRCASKKGMGAVLMQREKVNFYASRQS